LKPVAASSCAFWDPADAAKPPCFAWWPAWKSKPGGAVVIENRDVSHLPVSSRNVGIVFQSYALFPNLTARQNIAYGLKSHGQSRQAVRQRVDELLDLVGLRGMGRKYPAKLSGGQQQRVALARAIAVSPDLLLAGRAPVRPGCQSQGHAAR
jgi:ABC-type Fe3+/spermidine/putrescine transport system ATPase subunit